MRRRYFLGTLPTLFLTAPTGAKSLTFDHGIKTVRSAADLEFVDPTQDVLAIVGAPGLDHSVRIFVWLDGDTRQADLVQAVKSQLAGFRTGEDREGSWVCVLPRRMEVNDFVSSSADFDTALGNAVKYATDHASMGVTISEGVFNLSRPAVLGSIAELAGTTVGGTRMVLSENASIIVGREPRSGAYPGIRIKNLHLQASRSSLHRGIGILLGTTVTSKVFGKDSRAVSDGVDRLVVNSRLTDLVIEDFSVGVKFEGNCYGTRLDNSWMRRNQTGVLIDLDGVKNAGSNIIIRDCLVTDSVQNGVHVVGASVDGLAPKLFGVNSEHSAGYDYFFEKRHPGEMNVALIGCHSELPGTGNMFIGEGVTTMLTDCTLLSCRNDTVVQTRLVRDVQAEEATVRVTTSPQPGWRAVLDFDGLATTFEVTGVKGDGPFDVELSRIVGTSHRKGTKVVLYRPKAAIVNRGRLVVKGSRIAAQPFVDGIWSEGSSASVFVDRSTVISVHRGCENVRSASANVVVEEFDDLWRRDRIVSWKKRVRVKVGRGSKWIPTTIKYSRDKSIDISTARLIVDRLDGGRLEVFLRAYGSTDGQSQRYVSTSVISLTSAGRFEVDPVELLPEDSDFVTRQLDAFARFVGNEEPPAVTVIVKGVQVT